MQSTSLHSDLRGKLDVTQPLRVFIVDDNPMIRENLAKTLEELAPVHVAGWADGERAAVDWLQRNHHRCDLVVVDIFLHQGSGMNVLQHAQAAGWECALIVMSNYINFEVRQACLALGAQAVLDKSWDIELLATLCTDLQTGRLSASNSTIDSNQPET